MLGCEYGLEKIVGVEVTGTHADSREGPEAGHEGLDNSWGVGSVNRRSATRERQRKDHKGSGQQQCM